MRDDHFRRFLEQFHAGPQDKPLSKRAAGDYVPRCRRIEALLGRDLDAIDASPEALARLLAGRRATRRWKVRTLQTSARRYLDFRHAGTRA